jgi:hypothetical protein
MSYIFGLPSKSFIALALENSSMKWSKDSNFILFPTSKFSNSLLATLSFIGLSAYLILPIAETILLNNVPFALSG